MTVRFTNLDREFGLPEGTLDSVWAQESGRGTNRGNSSAGARGHFQFMPATRQDMIRNHGIDPWSDDPEVGARAAGIYLRGEMQRFGGNIQMALAAYNAGGGNVQRAVRNGGGNWLSRLPQETRNYVPQILARMGTNVDEMNGEEDFTRRYTSGQTTAEENAEHERRRRQILEAGGIDTQQMTPDMVLGQLFFGLIATLIQHAMDRNPQTAPSASTPESATPPAPAPSAALSAAVAARPQTPVTLDSAAPAPTAAPTTPAVKTAAAPQRSAVPA